MTTSYSIQMASKISGVGVHTIRAWEKRYKALEPNRDSAGHRVYSKSDVEKLMLLSELCLLGFSISKVANFSIEELKATLADLGKTQESSTGQEFHLVKEKIQTDLVQSRAILQLALKVFKLEVINQELGKIKAHISSREMALEILLPTMNHIRELASGGTITHVQEQAAYQLLCFHAGQGLYQTFEYDDLYELVLRLLCTYYGRLLFSFRGMASFEVLGEMLKHVRADLMIFVLSGAKKNDENFLEKIREKGQSDEVLIFGKMNLDREIFPSKKFTTVQTVEELDEFLSKKTNLKL